MTLHMPHQSPQEVARQALAHLEQVVRIDSASDESSDTIPSTPGQRRLVEHLAGFFRDHGAAVETDPHSNLVATLPARHGASGPPLALLVHVDTARGTRPLDRLHQLPAWDGGVIPYPARPSLQVSAATYPSLGAFVGHDLVHGDGAAPFGLDDKLGLAHLMTLTWLLATNPHIPHPTLLLIGRPDEEIGRMAAVTGLASLLAARAVRHGYTVDGIEAFEVNVANFNGAGASVWFPSRPQARPDWPAHAFTIGGVNTHGATAKAEGHRPATRLAAEFLLHLAAQGIGDDDFLPAAFDSDPTRDCDGVLIAYVRGPSVLDRATRALTQLLAPHLPRGASFAVAPCAAPPAPDGAAAAALEFVDRFLQSGPGFTLAAEDSEGWDGYSQPYRIVADPADAGGRRLDIRLRDFDPDQLRARGQHVVELAGALRTAVTDQYVNMGPALEKRPELLDWAHTAGKAARIATRELPIRGGTGVDPFLDAGVAIANLGTGYFAPESEKELTTVQLMDQHARWLLALVQVVGGAPGPTPR